MAARDDDFLGDGTVDPFTGLAPALTPEEEQRQIDARHAQARADATRTANTNYASNRGGPDYSSMSVAQLLSRKAAGDPLISQAMVDSARKLERQNHRAMNTGGYKALTYGILAAPAAITGGAAAFGGPEALGFGAGTGSIAAGDAGTAAAESAAASAEPAVQVANGATGLAQAGPGFSQEAANAYNAANAAGAAAPAAGAAPAAPGAAPSWLAEGGKLGGKLATAAAPFLIQAALGGKTKEEKALIAKQEQLAQEAKVRQGQQQDARMNQLGQQLLAFNPSNQLMAKMYGPDAAFQPEQMAAMAQGQAPANDPDIANYTGTDQAKLRAKREQIRRQNEYDAAEAARRDMLMSGVQRPGPGPTPIQMSAPQAARRY